MSGSNVIRAQVDEVQGLIAPPPTAGFPVIEPLEVPTYWNPDPSTHDCIESMKYPMVEAAVYDARRRHPWVNSLLGTATIMDGGMPVIKILQTDETNDFLLSPAAQGVNPGEGLTVPGALKAMTSYLGFVYQWAPYISEIVSLYDAHMAFSFHSRFSYIVTATGDHPAAFSPIWNRQLTSGEIFCMFGGLDPSAEEYSAYIEKTYPTTQPWNAVITAWPTHQQDHTVNSAGHTSVERFGHYHALLNFANGYSQEKGMLFVENYGGLMAAMPTADANSTLNLMLFKNMVRGAHWWLWKAQARTHCSVTTAMQFADALVNLAQMLNIDPRPLLRRLVVVEDWHNNIPDVVDPSGKTILPFAAWADKAFDRLERMGITRIRNSQDPSDNAKLVRIVTGVEPVEPMRPAPAGFDWAAYAAYEPY